MEGTPDAANMRDVLRKLDVFAGELPEFTPESAPEEPTTLFVDWLIEAIEAGVREPHAVTLSTTDDEGNASARVLLLKNVTADGWQFAVHAASPKGRHLAARPTAALTFYWAQQARQVRLRGRVVAEPAELSAADFLARSVDSRAEALVGRQSQPLSGRAELELATKQSMERVARDPHLVEPRWTLYTLKPDHVEFWQGDKQRKHTRLAYRHEAGRWTRSLLWP
jgi:pyridoxamine 5'-phosphate oxidase